MTPKGAVIYKFLNGNKFLIHGVSKTPNGPGIAAEPYIWIEGDASIHIVLQQMLFVINSTKTELPLPLDWKEFFKDFLLKTGLKKQSQLYKNTLHLSILKSNGMLIFIPMKNEGKNGFVSISKEKIEVSENENINEIVKVLEKAINMCE